MTKAKEAKFEEKWHREVGDTDNNPLAALDEVMEARKPPENAFTTSDLAKRYHLPMSRARHLADRLIADGKITEVGVIGHQRYFRVVK